MPVKTLKSHLDKNKVKYVTIQHSVAYTAQETAQSAHVSGHEFAKTVMVKLDGRMAMAVLRGDDRVDLVLLRKVADADSAELAGEDEFRGLFPGVEVGAMPPFGNLWDQPVYVDEALAANDSIAFNAGTHSEIMRLAWQDYRRLVSPVVARLSADEPAAGG